MSSSAPMYSTPYNESWFGNAEVLDFIFLAGFTSPDTEPFFSGVLVDWCTNEQGSDISASAVNGETCNPLGSARVLVVDP
jgi:hypothetical protein